MVDAHWLFTDLMGKVARCPTRESFSHAFVDEEMLIVGFRRAPTRVVCRYEHGIRTQALLTVRALLVCLAALLTCWALGA